jgi:hypothetical protein
VLYVNRVDYWRACQEAKNPGSAARWVDGKLWVYGYLVERR